LEIYSRPFTVEADCTLVRDLPQAPLTKIDGHNICLIEMLIDFVSTTLQNSLKRICDFKNFPAFYTRCGNGREKKGMFVPLLLEAK
jgi:hypothetical protein